MRGREKVLGPEHPDTLMALNNLGGFLQHLGERTLARALLERALRGRQKVLGPEHLNTLTTVFNLALLLEVLGDRQGRNASSV